MSVELPPDILAFLQQATEGCWGLVSEGQTALLVKTRGDEAYALWRAEARLDVIAEVATLALRLRLQPPVGPVFAVTARWNLAAAPQQRDAARLATQESLDIHFYDGDTDYAFSRRLSLSDEFRSRIADVVAASGLAEVPE